MTQEVLHSHSEALYSLLNRPLFDSDWACFKPVVEALTCCLCKYKDHLKVRLSSQNKRQSSDHPPRSVGSDISVQHRPKSLFVKEKFLFFYKVVSEYPDINKPIMFDESKHLHATMREVDFLRKYLCL